MVAVPLRLFLNERPFGSRPPFVILVTGPPDVVIEKENADLATAVTLAALVIAGATPGTGDGGGGGARSPV